MLTVAYAAIGRFIKAQDLKNDVYDKHLKDCNDVAVLRAVETAKLEGKLDTMVFRIGQLEYSMGSINGKLDKLLERRIQSRSTDED